MQQMSVKIIIIIKKSIRKTPQSTQQQQQQQHTSKIPSCKISLLRQPHQQHNIQTYVGSTSKCAHIRKVIIIFFFFF